MSILAQNENQIRQKINEKYEFVKLFFFFHFIQTEYPQSMRA